MELIIKYLIGIVVLLTAFPIGDYLARITREELKDGKKYFKLILIASVLGTILGIILMKIELIFWFLFVMIVTKRSLR